MMYIRYPLSLRQVEDLLADRGIVICHETVRFWWNRFDPMFAAEIRKRRIHHRSYLRWRWHLDEVFVRINGATHYLWRAVDHKGEVLEVFATKRRDRKVAERFNRFEQLAKSEMIYGPMSGREKTSYGHTIRWHPITDDEYFISIVERSDFDEYLDVLIGYVDEMSDRMSEAEGGRPSLEALRMWVLNAQRFWTKELGAPFTYTAFEGKGYTDASQFCYDCIQPLDPGVTESNLSTTIRTVIRREHKKSKNRPTKLS